MILKAGKFYDSDGNVVPLEHGNKDQIEILARVDVLRRDGNPRPRPELRLRVLRRPRKVDAQP